MLYAREDSQTWTLKTLKATGWVEEDNLPATRWQVVRVHGPYRFLEGARRGAKTFLAALDFDMAFTRQNFVPEALPAEPTCRGKR